MLSCCNLATSWCWSWHIHAMKIVNLHYVAVTTGVPTDVSQKLDEISAMLRQLLGMVSAASSFQLTASDCNSATWQKLEPELLGVMDLKVACTPPCCLLGQSSESVAVANPEVLQFEWLSGKPEDHADHIHSALEFLGAHLLPPGVTIVPAQSIQWLTGSFTLASTKLHIKSSRTDYVIVLEQAWDDLKQKLSLSIDGHKVNNKSILESHLPTLMPYIIGFYEVRFLCQIYQGCIRLLIVISVASI